ncbi:MAG: hypothetical protein IJ551_02585 [Prevotella sp.]|nr:hypothetical protein [Prevotella sp.]MBQ8711702.1 hypothetical protein [Prevotella sp.]
MRLSPLIRERLAQQARHELRLPSDCDYLSLDIESRTGIHIGSTTLKRLLGFAGDEREPHQSTLDVLARYMGYDHWQQLTAIDQQGNSGFDSPDGELRSASLQPGSTVAIAYLPDRMVTLQHLGDNRFRVSESRNSKLQSGDEVEIQNFILHHPLFVSNVWRAGKSIGQFTAGRISGLQSISIIEP